MSKDVIRLMVEREQRKQLAHKIQAWERVNGITFTPIKRDSTRSRMEQLVDEAMKPSWGGKV
jgi:hypothetical protein